MPISVRGLFIQCTLTIALLAMASALAQAGIFGTQALTGDADSGISAAKTYTHAFDLNRTGGGDGGALSINGVPFTGSGTATGGTDVNFGGTYTATGLTNTFDNHPTGVTGGIGDAIDDFYFRSGGGRESITLGGLTPGQHYKTVFYTSDGFGGNPQTIVFGDTLQQANGVVRNAGRIEYTYRANSTGEIAYAFYSEASGSFHQYAFTNEEVSGISLPQYEPIPGLFNTGVDDSGNVIAPGGGATDDHWTITSAPNSFSGPAVIQSNHPAWLANDAAGSPGSSWISIVDTGTTNIPAGDYTFETMFDLTDFDPDTAVIVLDIAADNSFEVFLNNDPTVLASGGGFAGLNGPFTLDDGFIDGLNTLQIVLNNAGTGDNPGGLRVQIAGTAQAVPEPASIALWSLLALAVASGGYFRFRRKQ